jgi:hypothetical protein
VIYSFFDPASQENEMSKPLNIQIVERARFLIEKEEHWCRGTLVLPSAS